MHDINGQIREMEDNMADNERLKEKSASNWARNVSNIEFRDLQFICLEIQ